MTETYDVSKVDPKEMSFIADVNVSENCVIAMQSMSSYIICWNRKTCKCIRYEISECL